MLYFMERAGISHAQVRRSPLGSPGQWSKPVLIALSSRHAAAGLSSDVSNGRWARTADLVPTCPPV